MTNQTIDAIEIKNFGVHKRWKRIEFKKTSNVIIGDNDSGKSTFFKALRIISSNRPANAHKKYAHNTEKDFFIAVDTTQDGNSYRIERTKKTYKIYLEDQLIHKLTKFGANAPEPVHRILPLKDINWEKQIPKIPFLIMETGGTANKKIIQAFGLIDQKLVQDDNKIQLGMCKSEFKISLKEKEKNKEIINFLEPIIEFKKRVTILKEDKKISLNLGNKIEVLTNLVNKLEEIKFITPEIINSFNERIERISNIIYERTILIEKINKLDSIIQYLKIIGKQIKDKKYITEFIDVFTRLDTLAKERDVLVSRIDLLDILLVNLSEYNQDLMPQIEKVKKEYEDLLNELGICPFCNSIIDGKHSHLEE